MKVETAVEFARKHFPQGPEKLAERLAVAVRYSALGGCDGWCLTTGSKTVIRINSARAKSSQRFTLAHELGHLLLGVPTVIGETLADMLGSDSDEEKRVNELAAELLIPTQVVQQFIQQPPVVAQSLLRLAKAGRVSPLAAAVRVTNLATELGLENAAVLQFERDELRWMWSPSLRATTADTSLEVLRAARNAFPCPYRHTQDDGFVVVASLIDNPQYESTTVFVQLLQPEMGLLLSKEERRQQLEKVLFTNNDGLRNSVQGCFGALKPKITGMSLDQAVTTFWSRQQKRFEKSLMNTDAGREYVRLRITELLSG